MTLCEAIVGLPIESFPEKDHRTELLPILTQGAEFLIRGGVQVPFEQWGFWSMTEREALAEAADRVRLSRLRDEMVSGSGARGFATVTAPLDGGETLRAVLLEERKAGLEQFADTLAGGLTGAH